MRDNASRRGAANLGILLMIVAFVAMAGFLYWLSLQAGTEQNVAVSEDSTAADTTGLGAATILTVADLQSNAAQFDGQVVRTVGLTVASTLGQQGFWLALPSGSPFLVSLSAQMRADSADLPKTGEEADVMGTMRPMSDSVVEAWTAAGTISEGDRAAASFAQYYIDATRARFKQPPAGTGATAGG